jgi:putative endonuclease
MLSEAPKARSRSAAGGPPPSRLLLSSQKYNVKTYFVYMVFCADGTYYIGMTGDLERRLAEHNHGVNPLCYTFSRRPVALVYSSSFDDIWEAIDCEKKLKGWSHWKKSALVRGDWGSVKALSKKHGSR